MDGYGPATYGDAFADVYDDWYADAGDAGAAADLVAELAGGGPVLELGVGSGRLAAPLAARGLDVWGLDASTAMLERLRTRQPAQRIHPVLGDMADPAAALRDHPGAPRRFGAVVAAFNTFFLLADEAAQWACLRSVATLLAPGRPFVLEAFVPADPPADAETVLTPRTVALDHVVLTVSRHDPARQLVTGQHIELRESGNRLRPWVLRYATVAQLDELAADAGLACVGRWGGWDRAPFDETSHVHVSAYAVG